MKSVGLLRVRDDLIRRCLFHPTAAPWEKVSALSQVGVDGRRLLARISRVLCSTAIKGRALVTSRLAGSTSPLFRS